MCNIAWGKSIFIIGLLLGAEVAMAEEIRKPVPGGTIVIPESSIPKPGRGHTNTQIFVPDRPFVQPASPAQPTRPSKWRSGKRAGRRR
jgi:hypothetical protein